jgi:hypothetical protein
LAEEEALLARFAKAAGAGEVLNIHDLKAAYEKAIGHRTSDSTVYNLLHRHANTSICTVRSLHSTGDRRGKITRGVHDICSLARAMLGGVAQSWCVTTPWVAAQTASIGFKLKIDTFETFGFEKWTLSAESGISILVRCRVALDLERLTDISVRFGTANGATIPALGVGPLATSSPAISG